MTTHQNLIHTRRTDRSTIAAAVKDINDRINGCGFSFMEDSEGKFRSVADKLKLNVPGNLIILASFDFSYYHDLEIVFYDVIDTNIGAEYSWWDHWTKDQLELSEENKPEGFEFRFNIGPHKEQQYIVRAKGFSYHFEKINYRH